MNAILDADSQPRSRGIGAVDATGRILQALLSLRGSARLKELEQVTGIPSATLHRYLTSMVSCGLLRREAGSMRYGFGLLAYQMGQVAAHSNDQISVIYPYVEEFAHAIGETCAIATWMDQGVVMVRWYEANKTISISLKPGRRVPLSTSSTGRMFGAFLPRATTESIVREEFQARGINTDAEVEKLYDEYAEIREVGLSQSIGKHIPGISSLSASVFDYTGQALLVISIIGNESTFDASMTGTNAQALVHKCKQLSRLLGSSHHVSAR